MKTQITDEYLMKYSNDCCFAVYFDVIFITIFKYLTFFDKK